MANLPDFSDLNLTKGGFYTLINELQTYLNDSIGSTGTPEGVKINLSLDSVNNTSDLAKPISTATQTALNTKQATLVAGTNIKTINSTSLLGSGNVNLQATLESGTNIKTINSASILGSGNINLMDLTSSQTIAGIKTFSSSPIVPTPTSGTEATNKDYVDGEILTATSEIEGVTTSSVLTATAGASFDGIGTYVLARINTSSTVNKGTTVSGSVLTPTSADGLSATSTLSGTWRCMGYINNYTEAIPSRRTSLFLRIA